MELLEIIATIGISAVVSLTVCLVENKVRLKLKKIEINEKHYDNDKRIEENLNNNTRSILEKYLEAAMSLLTQISKAFAVFLKDRQNNTTS